MVGMIDPPTVNARRSVQSFFSMMNRMRPIADPLVERSQRWIFRILALFDQFQNLPRAQRWVFLRDTVRRRLPSRSKHLPSNPATDYLGVLQSDDERNPEYTRAVSTYIPAPLAVHVIYFAVEYGLGAWARISPNSETIKIPGGHGDIDLTAFAFHLRSKLKAAN
jgi:hypothetical protein